MEQNNEILNEQVAELQKVKLSILSIKKNYTQIKKSEFRSENLNNVCQCSFSFLFQILLIYKFFK